MSYFYVCTFAREKSLLVVTPQANLTNHEACEFDRETRVSNDQLSTTTDSKLLIILNEYE